MIDLLAILVAESNGGLLCVDETRLAQAPAKRSVSGPKAVAVVPIMGVLMPRTRETWFGTIYGMDRIRAQLAQAVNNPEIGSIMLLIDSPGGTVMGTPETAAAVRAAAEAKPVIAFADGLAASAAYYIGSQATEFVATASADVGSIGVLAVHQSYAKMLDRAGIETTVIRSVDYKGEGNPYEPLSPDALAFRQQQADEAHTAFVQAVAAGRKVSEKRVREDFGKGRALSAQQAAEVGMIDRIASFDEVMAGMTLGRGRAFRPRRTAFHF